LTKLKRRQCQIELLIQAGATIKLIVKVFNKPIGDLTGMPWREKMHYAGLLWSKFVQIQGFIEKALQDLKNNRGVNTKWQNQKCVAAMNSPAISLTMMGNIRNSSEALRSI